MIFFFDFFYMICCDYYQKFRSERVGEEWRVSAIFIVAIATAAISILIVILSDELFVNSKIENLLYSKVFSISLFIVLFIVLFIRYKRFTNYEEIVSKVRKLSKTKRIVYQTLVIFYLFIAFPLTVFCAIYFSPTGFSINIGK